MPRRRRYLTRPHEHLRAAAALHAAAAAGELYDGTAGESEEEGELSAQQELARSQHRDQGGKFTA